MADRPIEVHVQIVGHDFLAGTLWVHRRRGAESATFRYDPAYLAARGSYPLDPSLPLVSGPLQTPLGHSMFLAFSDCAPDSWGRKLIGQPPSNAAFGEAEYLLGARDDLRQGSLRFRDPETGAFLAEDARGIPELDDLERLIGLAAQAEQDAATEEELNELAHAGGSLGGSRPKSHVVDADGRTAIAKLPSVEDDWDVEAWEAVALELGRRSGLDVAASGLHPTGGRPALIVERFDRVGSERVGYVSAATLLEAPHTPPYIEQPSYLDLAEAIEEHSDRATTDLHELWRRIAFSILVSNTDDHLRNHGFLRRSSGGWSLSPAFDINPDPSQLRKRLKTSIDGRSFEADLELLFGVAEQFRLDDTELSEAVATTSAATSRWREVATEIGLSQAEAIAMAPAFEHESAELARQLARVASV